MKTRIYRGCGKMNDACPKCMGTLEVQKEWHQKHEPSERFIVATAAFTGCWKDEKAIWECNNCAHILPRKARKTKDRNPAVTALMNEWLKEFEAEDAASTEEGNPGRAKH